MNEFKTYNPIVNFTYFLFVIGISMFVMHPVFLPVSLISSVITGIIYSGGKRACKTFLMILPMVICAMLINPLFNHKGQTILAYFPNGNPFTLESVYYAAASSVMIISVIFFFSCFNHIVTSDKFIYLFGKIIPTLSLVLSMTLRFIPKFVHEFRETVNARKALGRSPDSGGFIKRCKNWIKVISAMTTASLENAVDVSDSMKSRGYGLSGRTAYSIYKFEKRDLMVLLWILFHAVVVLTGFISGSIYYSYFPMVSFSADIFSVISVTAYLCLCITPIIIEIREVYRWKSIESKI